MPPSKTANPDTPAEELAQLAARYPAQALANPVLALLHAREQAQPDRTLHRCLVLRQGHTPATAAQLLHHTATTDRALRLLLQLGYPALLSADNRATLAASPVAADRLSVAHLPDYQAQLRDDPHLLVRLVARGEASAAS